MDNRLTEKIRHLLAMAEHPGSNENEAAIAMRKAQELLLANNLIRADIKDTNTPAMPPGIGKIDIIESIGFNWKRSLIYTIAINNLCTTISSPHENTTHLFGTYENVHAVLEMYHWLGPELERIALQAWSTYKEDGTGRENARVWKLGFFMGAIAVINKKLQASLQEFSNGPGYAIVLYNAELLKDAVKRVFPYTIKGRYSSSSYDGRVAGRAAGQNINIRPQRKLTGTLALKGA